MGIVIYSEDANISLFHKPIEKHQSSGECNLSIQNTSEIVDEVPYLENFEN